MTETGNEFIKMTLDFANQTAQQIMTLSVGVLAISITFTKDIVNKKSRGLLFLKSAWFFFLLSIPCGLLVMTRLTGLTTRKASDPSINPISQDMNDFEVFLVIQFLFFLLGCILLCVYGAISLKREKNKTTDSSTEKD